MPVAYLWGLADTVNPIRIPNYVWLNYLNERDVESSFWVLPTAGHYPQREKPEQVEKIIRLVLDGEVPSPEEEKTRLGRRCSDHERGEGEIEDQA